MKVLLINPGSPFLTRANAQPPLGILYLASVLEANAISVDVWDIPVGLEWDLEGYDFYGITATTPQYYEALRFLNIIRSVTDAPVCLGGSHASSVPFECYQDGWDYVVIGEAESTVCDLVCGKHERGIVQGLSPSNIDQLLMPAREKVVLSDYCPEMTATGTIGTILTSRGCPFNCAFCSKTVFPKGIKFHSAQRVFDEVLFLRNQGIDNFIFLDDCFTLNRKRVFELSALLSSLDVHFRCITRSDLVNKEILESLKVAGCSEISFGIESGSQKVLDRTNKHIKTAQNLEALLLARDFGILTKAYLMYGLPLDDEESAKQTLEFVHQAKPDKWLLSTFVPLPGSDIWNNPQAYGIKHIDQDYCKYFTAGKEGKGGMVVEYNHISLDRMRELRDNLLIELKKYKEMNC